VFDSSGKTLLKNQLTRVTEEIETFADVYKKVQKSRSEQLPSIDIVKLSVTGTIQPLGSLPPPEQYSLLLDDCVEFLCDFDRNVKYINFFFTKIDVIELEVDSSDESTSKDAPRTVNTVLMAHAQMKTISWTKDINKKDHMARDFLKFAEEQNLNIKFPGTMTQGECEVQLAKVINAFWYLDGRKQQIVERSGKDFNGKLPPR
jgi:hypothetical protein